MCQLVGLTIVFRSALHHHFLRLIVYEKGNGIAAPPMQTQFSVKKKGNANSPGKRVREYVCVLTLTVRGVSGVVFLICSLNSESENTLDYHNEVVSVLCECVCVCV